MRTLLVLLILITSSCKTVKLSEAKSIYDFPSDNLIEYGLSKEYVIHSGQFRFTADSSFAILDSLYVFQRDTTKLGDVRYYLTF